jgi:Uncharacterized conserved protein
MPGAARLGDMDTGHGPYPPRACTEGSGNVLVNGLPFHRQKDAWGVHCSRIPPVECHTSVLQRGSGSVFVNGRQAGRIDDPIECGGTVATGSGNVIVG